MALLPPPIEVLKVNVSGFINEDKKTFNFECKDVTDVAFKKASIFISYYTFQFILPSVRQDLVNKIYDSLAWGGAFFVFEKTRGHDARFQDMNTHVYNEYKINKGYSPSEIFSKSRALTGVLEPFSDNGNIDMFKRAGFKDIQYILFHR